MPDKLSIAAQGCYIDNNKTRDLPIQVLADNSNMTVDACIAACAEDAYTYAGVQVYYLVPLTLSICMIILTAKISLMFIYGWASTASSHPSADYL